jgi:mannose-1-phosphate guanylyltransferase
MLTKTCKQCGQELPLDRFELYTPKWKDKVYPRNTRNYCKVCHYTRRKNQRKGKAYVDRGDVSWCNGCFSWLPLDKFSINNKRNKPASYCKKCKARQNQCKLDKKPFIVININYFEYFLGEST